jgi:hypothetical protein
VGAEPPSAASLYGWISNSYLFIYIFIFPFFLFF